MNNVENPIVHTTYDFLVNQLEINDTRNTMYTIYTLVKYCKNTPVF